MPVAATDLRFAEAYIKETGCNIFLTGKAGTGKTTFLRRLKHICPKRLVVTAPTGVAAINAGGVTLHSFFQLPFGPFLPGADPTRRQVRFSRQKIDIIRSLDLLVIDEISMVRADLLDGVDSVLRRHRRSDQPFGDVQLLMIGDLFQLPPVVKETDWALLGQYYASPYFFSSTALAKTDMVTIELKHIYRQTDGQFIDLLNRVRTNRVDPATLAALNARHRADFVPRERDGTITLGTHNRIADAINDSRLKALPKKRFTFDAQIEGDVPEHSYPTAATLELKQGAQVMFVRNDLSPEKRYYNGKIGTITRISDKGVHIRCPGDASDIVVEPATWENIDYRLNRETHEIVESKIGAFTQYPLRLAWAITIHKSQGLTFDKVIIDAQAAFAHGQVYVALSRCRTLDGIVLSSPLRPASVRTDPAVIHFSNKAEQNRPSAVHLEHAKIRYQQRLLTECFDFGRLRALLRRVGALTTGNRGLIHLSGVADIRALQQQAEDRICSVGDKFLRQLQGLFSKAALPTADPEVRTRIAKASAYFQETIAADIGQSINHLKIDTDNQALRQRVNLTLNHLRAEIAVKLAAVKCCEKGFSSSTYFRAVSAAAIGTEKQEEHLKAPTYSESDIAHPEIFDRLKEWRRRKAQEQGRAHYQVLHQKTLIQIAVNLPDTLPALKAIKGIGKRLAASYGEELIALVGDYRREHQIEAVMLPTPTPADAQPKRKKQSRIDTKEATLDLFNKGMNLNQIAKERGLVLSTIEGHMAHWVETGEVDIRRLLLLEKQKSIEKTLERMQGKLLSEIKQALGAEISYGEIKLVQAYLKGPGKK